MSDEISEGDTVTVHGRSAEVLRLVGSKMRVRFEGGGIGYDYIARHALPSNCRRCGREATHRVEVNAPGNGDCYAACPDCADAATGRYVTTHEADG